MIGNPIVYPNKILVGRALTPTHENAVNICMHTLCAKEIQMQRTGIKPNKNVNVECRDKNNFVRSG